LADFVRALLESYVYNGTEISDTCVFLVQSSELAAEVKAADAKYDMMTDRLRFRDARGRSGSHSPPFP
jgi:hypothetical protein